MSKAVAPAQANWRLKPATRLAALDGERARLELADIASVARDEGLARLAGFLRAKGDAQDFLAAVFDLSPFLRDTARRRPEILEGLFDETVETRLNAIVVAIDNARLDEALSESGLMMALRRWKAEAHLSIALADLAGEAET